MEAAGFAPNIGRLGCHALGRAAPRNKSAARIAPGRRFRVWLGGALAALIEPAHDVGNSVADAICRNSGFGRSFAARFEAIPGAIRKADHFQRLRTAEYANYVQIVGHEFYLLRWRALGARVQANVGIYSPANGEEYKSLIIFGYTGHVCSALRQKFNGGESSAREEASEEKINLQGI